MDECDEIVEETSLVKANSAKCKHNSCILCIVLFSIFFTINIGITIYFIYYKYMNRNKENVSNVYYAKNYKSYKMGGVKQINIKNRTFYFYNGIIDLNNFDARLLKIDRKSYKNIGIYSIGYIIIKKTMIAKIFIMQILCIYLLLMQADILKKKVLINI